MPPVAAIAATAPTTSPITTPENLTVNDLDLLAEQLRQHPGEQAVRMMYRDELVAQTGCSPEDARRACAGIWVPAFMNNQQLQAVYLLERGDALGEQLRRLIRQRCRCRTDTAAVFIVSQGNSDPMYGNQYARLTWPNPAEAEQFPMEIHTHQRMGASPNGWWILVGAGYVLKVVKDQELYTRFAVGDLADEQNK